jgi:hypothetical protein
MLCFSEDLENCGIILSAEVEAIGKEGGFGVMRLVELLFKLICCVFW